MGDRPKKLLDQVRDRIRLKHYSIRTEKFYISWIKRYILFHDKRHPKDMGEKEIESFLTHLAVDLNFEMNQIVVRNGKGAKDRVTVLAENAKPDLKAHLEKVKMLHEEDLAKGYGKVYLPNVLERKYRRANRQWGWQYVFPSKSLSKDPRKGKVQS